jgi:hypothetical protein
MRDVRNPYKILVSKFEGKGALGTSKCKWEVDIKGNIEEIEGACGSIG